MAKVAISCRCCQKEFLAYQSARRSYCCTKCFYESHSIARHGESGSRLHVIWCSMKNRCKSTKGMRGKYYGGNGISVCAEWSSSYEAFRDWAISSGYQDGLEIDRRDPNGGYDPKNCRWATRSQQMQNTNKRADAKTSSFKGVSLFRLSMKWRAQISHNKKNYHLGLFGTEQEAAAAYDAAATRMFGEFANINNKQGGAPS